MAAAKLVPDETTLAGLAKALDNVIHIDLATRRASEELILGAFGMPGFSVCLLKLVTHQSVSADVRLQAAIQFKNLVAKRWLAPEDAVAGSIPEEDKAPVREFIIDLMLTTEPLVRAQLSAAVACISNIDFPDHWPGLLPGLAKHAGSSDPSVIIGVLETAAAVFERFDGAYECDEVNIALKAALDGFSEPLHGIFGTLSAAIGPALAGGASTLPQLKLVLTAFDLAGQCFHHLCYPVLADEMNDRLSVSIPALMNILKVESAALDADADGISTGPLECAQATVCRVASLFASKHDDDFAPHFPGMVGGVWQLLTRISKSSDGVGSPRFGTLLAQGIGFLSAAARRPMYRSTFEAETTITSIVDHIVIPNMCLQEDDDDVFEGEPMQFIVQDLEGSDTESRRRSAAELIKGLSTQFETRIGSIVLARVTDMIAKYNADKANCWRELEAATAMVSALAIRGSTRAQGVTELSPTVDPLQFFTTCILPILSEGRSGPAALNAQPMLKAAALRYVTTFRNQFSAGQLQALMDVVLPFLSAESEVVNTYAAAAIESFVGVRGDPVTAPTGGPRDAGTAALPAAAAAAALAARVMARGSAGPYRLDHASLAPHLPTLLPMLAGHPTKLADAAAAGDTNARRDNPYHLRCASRVFSVCRSVAGPAAGPSLGAYAGLLGKVLRDPCRPRMQHYLFEAICAAGRAAVAASGPASADTLDAGLREPFQAVLSGPVPELLPYVLQTLALIARMGSTDGADVASGAATGAAAGKATAAASPLSAGTKALIPVAMAEAAWADSGVVPALAAFLGACVTREPASIGGSPDVLNAVCGRIVTAAGKRATEGAAFALFRALVRALPATAIAPVLAPAMQAFVARLMRVAKSGGVRFLRHLLPTMATVAGVHGGAALLSSLDTALASGGGAVGFVTNIAGPQLNKVIGRADRRTCLVGWSRFLAESPAIARDAAALKALVLGLSSLAMAASDDTVGSEEMAAEAEENAAVRDDTGSRFSRLVQAAPALERSDGLPCADVAATLTSALGAVAAAVPGALPAVLGSMETSLAIKIKEWCDAKGVTLA